MSMTTLAAQAINTPYQNDLENQLVCWVYTYAPTIDYMNEQSFFGMLGAAFGWLLAKAF